MFLKFNTANKSTALKFHFSGVGMFFSILFQVNFYSSKFDQQQGTE